MKNKIFFQSMITILAFVFLSSPLIVNSASNVTSESFQIVPEYCGTVEGGKILEKNQGGCGWEDLLVLMGNIMKFAVYISASLSAIAFAYAGFLYITAFGQSGKIEQAHGIFSKTLIGIFFVLCAYLLVALVLKSLGVNDKFSLINF